MNVRPEHRRYAPCILPGGPGGSRGGGRVTDGGMMRDHRYFGSEDEDGNNQVDAIRAACYKMNADNLWEYAQMSLIKATESQAILLERFPENWKKFNALVDPDSRA